MNFRVLTTDAYSKLHELIASNSVPQPVPLLGYEYSEGKLDFIYSLQESDFTREFVNIFNIYALQIGRLTLWEEVFRSYAPTEILELRLEFTKLPLDYCLSAPYKFKSRIVFGATELCYTKGLADKLISKKDVRAADKINMDALIKVVRHWVSGAELVKALGDVDAENYRKTTGNYRNKSQHRHPPGLDFGLMASVGRSFPPDCIVSYSFGELPPLATNNVLSVLVAESDRMKTAFLAYRALIEEQLVSTTEEHQNLRKQ